MPLDRGTVGRDPALRAKLRRKLRVRPGTIDEATAGPLDDRPDVLSRAEATSVPTRAAVTRERVREHEETSRAGQAVRAYEHGYRTPDAAAAAVRAHADQVINSRLGFGVRAASHIVAPLRPEYDLQESSLARARRDREYEEAGPLGRAGIIGGRFVSGATRAALGFPAGVVKTAFDPIEVAKGVGGAYAYKYGPAVHGDLGETLHRAGEDPFGTALDAAAVATGGTLAATKGGATVPMTRTVRYMDDSFQPYASPNPLARIGQHRLDRWSEQDPGRFKTGLGKALHDRGITRVSPELLRMGARDRYARRVPFELERTHERGTARLIPFAEARSGLKGGEEVAYDLRRRYGDDPAVLSERAQQEIDSRRARLAAVDDQGVPVADQLERDSQLRTLSELESALPFLEGTPKLNRAVEEGRALSRQDEQIRQRIGAIGDDAEEHVHMSSRLVTGGRFVDHPAPSPVLREARVRQDRLAKLHEKAILLRDKNADKELGRADARAADLERQAGAARRPVSQAEVESELQAAQREWDGYLDKLEKQVGHPYLDPKQYKAETRKRNIERAKAERQKLGITRTGRASGASGRKVTAQPTIKQEIREFAEAKLNALLDERHDDPALEPLRAARARVEDAKRKLDSATDPDVMFGDKESIPFGETLDEREAARLRALADRAKLQRVGTRLLGENRVIAPRGDARVERLGGALSVQRDRVEQLERRALAKHGVVPGDTGGFELVGGEDAGAGAFYGPDMPRTKLRDAFRRKTGLGKQGPLTHRSRGVLFEQGRARRDTRPTLESAASTVKRETWTHAVERAAKVSRPLGDGEFNPETEALLNPEGLRLPRALRENADAIEGMSPREVLDSLQAEGHTLHGDVFPSLEEYRRLPAAMQQKVRVIDRKVKAAFERGEFAAPSSDLAAKVAGFFDSTNNVNKAALIYLKGSYVPLNFAGNLAFLALQQGPWAPLNLKNSVMSLSKFEPETLRWFDREVGQGGASILGGEGKGITARVTQKVADVSGALADRLPRRAALMHELARIGVKSEEDVQRLRAEVAAGPQGERAVALNQASERAEQAMVKFRGLSQFERKLVSRAIFIYPWVRGATRYAGRLGVDHPFTALLAAHIGEEGADDIEKRLGQLSAILDGLIPFGPAENRLGTKIQRVRSASSITPFGTGAEFVEGARGLVAGDVSRKHLPIQFATPVVRGLTEAATHYDSFLGREHDPGKSALRIFGESFLGTLDNPRVPAAAAVATAFRKPQGEDEPFDGPPSRQRQYVREGGLKDALKVAFLGGARERELNLTAAQARAAEDRLSRMPAPARAVERERMQQREWVVAARKAGMIGKKGDFTPEFRALLNTRVSRVRDYAEEAQRLDKPLNRLRERERLQVDVRRLVREHKFSPQDAKGMLEAVAVMSDEQVESLRRKLLDSFYGEGQIRTVTSSLRRQGLID